MSGGYDPDVRAKAILDGAAPVTAETEAFPAPPPRPVLETIPASSPAAADTARTERFSTPTQPPLVTAAPLGTLHRGGIRLSLHLADSLHQRFMDFREDREQNGYALIRLLAATEARLRTHFAATAAPLDDTSATSFVIQAAPPRWGRRKESMRKMTANVSHTNAAVIQQLLNDCGLGNTYSILIETAIELLDTDDG